MPSSPTPATTPPFQAQAAALRARTEAELRASGLLAAGQPPPPRSASEVRAALRAIGGSDGALLSLDSFAARVAATKAVIDSLGYNHGPVGSYHHGVDKTLPFARLAASAARMLADPAPLKCVEACALALVLTAGWEGVDRFALGFRSSCGGGADQPRRRHRHVVVALRLRYGCGDAAPPREAWAALGASRAPSLLGGVGPLFPSLSSLVARYAAGYASLGHMLERVRMGAPAPHSLLCLQRATWRRLRVSVPATGEEGWAAVADQLDAFAAGARRTGASASGASSARASSAAG